MDYLSANEFRRRYRMGVKSFNLLVSLMKPYLYPMSGKEANSSIIALLGSDGGSARTVATWFESPRNDFRRRDEAVR